MSRKDSNCCVVGSVGGGTRHRDVTVQRRLQLLTFKNIKTTSRTWNCFQFFKKKLAVIPVKWFWILFRHVLLGSRQTLLGCWYDTPVLRPSLNMTALIILLKTTAISRLVSFSIYSIKECNFLDARLRKHFFFQISPFIFNILPQHHTLVVTCNM